MTRHMSSLIADVVRARVEIEPFICPLLRHVDYTVKGGFTWGADVELRFGYIYLFIYFCVPP